MRYISRGAKAKSQSTIRSIDETLLQRNATSKATQVMFCVMASLPWRMRVAMQNGTLGGLRLSSMGILDEAINRYVDHTLAFGIMMLEAPHFFTHRMLSPAFGSSPNAAQLVSVTSLH
jgi:hypothetical protein